MLTLGIDYGTTKNAVVIYDSENPQNVIAASAAHHAALERPAGIAEQDFNKVWSSILDLIAQLPQEALAQVRAVGLTGQMHSMVCWNDEKISPVVTWQDKRASNAGILNELCSRCGRKLADGFGGTTLAVMAENGELASYTHCANPVSLIAAKLTNSIDKPLMEATFGASWGVWDIKNECWDMQVLNALNIPEAIMPGCVKTGSCVGFTVNIPGLPDGLPVCTPFGDNQASVFSTAGDTAGEVYLTLGTGAQLSAVIPADNSLQLGSAIELRPFIGGQLLAVHAPLCGGKAWAVLGEMVNSIFTSLGFPPLPEKELLDKLDALALQSTPENITFSPLFLGSRQQPADRAEISGISLDNFRIAPLAASLARGIVAELFAPFPDELLHSRHTVLGSGNCVRFCAAIRQEIVRQSNLELKLKDSCEEAACGAAKLATIMTL